MRSPIPAPHRSTMPPQSSPRKDRTVALVLAGEVSPKTAVTVGLASPAVQIYGSAFGMSGREKRSSSAPRQRKNSGCGLRRRRAASRRPTALRRRRRGGGGRRCTRSASTTRMAWYVGASSVAATAAGNHRPTEEIDRGLARALEERKRADERAGAPMVERRAAVRAGKAAGRRRGF